MDSLGPPAPQDGEAGVWDEVRARLLIDALPRVGLVAHLRLLQVFGSARAALSAPAGQFDRVARTRASRARGDVTLSRRVDAAVRLARRQRQGVVLLGAPGYPERLLHLTDPPLVLFLRGRGELLGAGGVAVVGSRRATERGRSVARDLGRALASTGVNVLSGLALGIDGAAHGGALEARGPTTAVMGRGADAPYPRGHARVFARILESGLVISEFAPSTPPLPHNFPRRNRLLAALADAVVVVEAAERSGALITVEHALDVGVDVWAVPGPIDGTACRGSNALLRDGASPLVSIDEFVSSLPVPRDEVAVACLPDGTEGLVLGLLGDHPREAAVLAREAKLALAKTLSILSTLAVEGWVERLPGMRFRRVA